MDKKDFTIIYVDDEEQNLISFRASFRRDYKILTAISGQEAIDILKENNVHLIITDQRMPEMTGIQFLEKIMAEFALFWIIVFGLIPFILPTKR